MSGGNWKELFNAACEGDLALVAYHVKAGVDVNYAHPEFLATPLVACILAGQEEVAVFLLDNGANPYQPSEFDGLTPIQAAQKVGSLKVRAKLVSLGVEPPAAEPRRLGWVRRSFGKRVDPAAGSS